MDRDSFFIQLDECIKQGKEVERIEYKLNNFDPQTLWENISAIANSTLLHSQKLGYIIFGIKDTTLEYLWTNQKLEKWKIWWEDIETRLFQRLRPKIDFRIYEEEKNGKHYIMFFIPKAVNEPIKFSHKAYIRVWSHTKHLNEYPEKEKKIRKLLTHESFETQIAYSHASEWDITQLLDYPSFFRLLDQPLPETRSSIITKFEEEWLIQRNPHWSYDILNLWAILFANNLKKFGSTKRKWVRVITYVAKNKLETYKEIEWAKWYASWFEWLVDYIMDQIQTREKISTLRESWLFPKIIVRELVANALIHQDFFETGMWPMVEIFSNRIEITNPGKPLIKTERFLDHTPKSRNEDLASFMRRINICEERWSWVDKVMNNCEKYNLRAPEIQSDDIYTKVIVFTKSWLSWLTEEEKNHTTYWHCCLKYINHEYMSNESLRKRFDIEKKDSSIASRIINKCLEKKLIKPLDPDSKSKKMIKYIPWWA